MTRGSERTLRKSSVSKDFSRWQEWKGLPNREGETPGAGGKEELVGAPEEAAFSYLVAQEQAETPWRSEGQSVTASCFIRRPILITLPSQLGIGHLCLFLLQRLLALPHAPPWKKVGDTCSKTRHWGFIIHAYMLPSEHGYLDTCHII